MLFSWHQFSQISLILISLLDTTNQSANLQQLVAKGLRKLAQVETCHQIKLDRKLELAALQNELSYSTNGRC